MVMEKVQVLRSSQASTAGQDYDFMVSKTNLWNSCTMPGIAAVTIIKYSSYVSNKNITGVSRGRDGSQM